MKKLLLTLTLFPLFSWGQRELQQENFFGKIKSIESKTFSVNFNTPEINHNYHIINKLQDNGEIFIVEFLGNDEIMDNKEMISYFPNGLIKEVAIFNKDNRKDKIISFIYNDKFQLVKETKTETQNGVEYESIFEYNDQNQLNKKIQNFPSIDYTVTENFKYFNNRLSELYKETHSGINIEKYLYNDKGLLLEKTEINNKNVIFSTILYEYNEKDLKTALIKIDESGAISYFEQYEYQYDSKGNWIEKKIYIKGDWTSVEKRNFTYF